MVLLLPSTNHLANTLLAKPWVFRKIHEFIEKNYNIFHFLHLLEFKPSLEEKQVLERKILFDSRPKSLFHLQKYQIWFFKDFAALV